MCIKTLFVKEFCIKFYAHLLSIYTLFTIWPFSSICSKFVASAMLNTIKIVIKLAMVKKIELLCHCEEGCVEDSFVLHDSQKWNHQTNYRFLKVFTIKSSNCTKERKGLQSTLLCLIENTAIRTKIGFQMKFSLITIQWFLNSS